MPSLKYFLALRAFEAGHWTGIPSPGSYVPLALHVHGVNADTLIDRAWVQLPPIAGEDKPPELVLQSAAVAASLWHPTKNTRFDELQEFVQPKIEFSRGRRPNAWGGVGLPLPREGCSIHVRVVGRVDQLVLICSNRETLAGNELPLIRISEAAAKAH